MTEPENGPREGLRWALEDAVDEGQESWRGIVRQGAIVALVAAAVWGLTSAVRWLCELGLEALFGLFERPDAGWAVLVLLAALVVGGLVRAVITRHPSWQPAIGDAIEHSMASFHVTHRKHTEQPTPRHEQPALGLAAKRSLTTVLTLGTGGSGGLEGPAVMLGETLGAWLSRLCRTRSAHELRIYQMAGIAAGISTLLDAPFAAAIFAAEIAYSAAFVYRLLAYGLLAGVVAYALNNHVLAMGPLFSAPGVPLVHTYSLAEYGGVALVAILISAPAAILMTRLLKACEHFFRLCPALLRAPLGALLTGLVAAAGWWWADIEPRHVLGMGERTIREILDASGPAALRSWWALCAIVVLRAITTALTLRSGGSVGTLVPAMFLGGVGGAAAYFGLAQLGIELGPYPAIAVVAGIAAGLTAVAHVPLASVALVLEVFGAGFGPPAVVACAVCHISYSRFRLYGR